MTSIPEKMCDGKNLTHLKLPGGFLSFEIIEQYSGSGARGLRRNFAGLAKCNWI